MKECTYLHKLCPKDGCDNYSCRAYFPERQPLIKKDMLPLCKSRDHSTCDRFIDANVWRKQKKMDALKIHCPFATNNRCGRPWEWRCDAYLPFKLTTYEIREGTDDIPIRDENGEIKFTYDKKLLEQTCFSGKVKIYESCPNYKKGIEHREYINQLKKQEKEEYSE